MTVYVDELRRHPNAPRCFRWGACHMTTDGPVDELHAMAEKLGLKRAWFQDHSRNPHYDLSARMREIALEEGCIFKTAREQAIERLARISRAGLFKRWVP